MTENNESPYVVENEPKRNWLKSKPGKLTAAIVGTALVLGGTFATGVAVGSALGPRIAHEIGNPFDRDGDHRGFGDDDGGFQPGQNQPAPPANGQNG